MTYNEILSAAQSLSETERQSLLQALSVGNQCEATVPESSRLSASLGKQGCCPHCGSNRYYRFGKDHGTQRFKCKDCGRTFSFRLAAQDIAFPEAGRGQLVLRNNRKRRDVL